MIQETEKIPGGTVFHCISSMDPAGSFWVRCDRHPEQYTVEVKHNYFDIKGFDVKGTIFDQAVDLLAKCPECVKESIIVVSPSCPQEEHDACGCAQ